MLYEKCLLTDTLTSGEEAVIDLFSSYTVGKCVKG